MPQLNGPQFQFRPGFAGWLRLALTLAIGAATLAALAFLAFSLLAILIPVALIGGLLFYFFGPPSFSYSRSEFRKAGPASAASGGTQNKAHPINQDVIDAEYKVINPDKGDEKQ